MCYILLSCNWPSRGGAAVPDHTNVVSGIAACQSFQSPKATQHAQHCPSKRAALDLQSFGMHHR